MLGTLRSPSLTYSHGGGPRVVPTWHETMQAVKVQLVTASIATAVWLLPQGVSAAAIDYSWAPCAPGSPCVSSNSFMQPAQYMAPWLYQTGSQDAAFRALLVELAARSGEVVQLDAAAGYVRAHVPFGSGRGEVDTLQFLVKPDGVVLFKSQAAVQRPYPPFCLTPGCISGPGNRQRLEALRDDLGWTVLEPDEDKQWVQILLH